MVEKKCVDSLTPLISTGVTLNHLLRLCCRERWGDGPHSSQPGKCSVGSMGLCGGAHVTSVPQRLEEVSQHCSVHSGPVECSSPGRDGLDSSACFSLTGDPLGVLLWPGSL